MGRLSAVKSGLTAAAPRLSEVAHVSRAGANRRRSGGSMYKTSRWQKLRKLVIAERAAGEAGLTCEQTGAALLGTYPAWNSAVVDHIRPHRGDEALFFDRRNLQVVSKCYHDQVKQSLERSGLA